MTLRPGRVWIAGPLQPHSDHPVLYEDWNDWEEEGVSERAVTKAMIDARYAQGWQPIETASPREEQNVLLFCPGLTVSGPHVVAYRQQGRWCSAWSGEPLISCIEITHWKPLDEPHFTGTSPEKPTDATSEDR